MEWETRELKFEGQAGARVFQCEVLFSQPALPGQRWLSMDGIVLGDGRVLLNKADSLRQSAARAGLDGAAIAAELARWIGERARAAEPELAAAAVE